MPLDLFGSRSPSGSERLGLTLGSLPDAPDSHRGLSAGGQVISNSVKHKREVKTWQLMGVSQIR